MSETGAQRIAAERQRQIDEEGWSTEHDAEHGDDHLARAAACYALPRYWRDHYGLARETEVRSDAPQRTDYETRLGEHYDPAGMDPVFGGTPCPATHPVTGRPCVYPEGHYEHHWAMGVQRMQMFGPDLTCAPAPAGDSGGERG